MVSKQFVIVALLSGLVSASPSAAQSAAPATPAALLDAIERPQIAGEIDLLAALTLGQSEIRPLAGARVFLLEAGDRPCGVLIDGPVAFRHRVSDRMSVPLARRHGRRASGLTLRDAENGAVEWTATLRGAAIWGWDLVSDVPAPRPAALSTLPDWLAGALDDKLSVNPGRDMLLSLLNHESGYRWALLRGDGDDLMLDLDPRPSTRIDSLHRVRRLSRNAGPFGGKWTTEELSAQPIAGAWWTAPPFDFAAVEYALDVRHTAGDHVEVHATARVEALRGDLAALSLRLANGSIRAGGDVRPYAITSLTVDGTPAPYVQRRSDLIVVLPRPLAAGSAAVVDLTTEGDILERPQGDSFWRLADEAWYPRPGVGGVERAAFRVSVSTPAPFTPFAPGDIVERKDDGAVRRVVTRLNGPMASIHVIAGRYASVTESDGERRVHVSTYAAARKQEATRVARIALGVQDCLGEWLGVPYPFNDLQIVEITEWGWGQAPPGFIFVTKEAFISQARSNVDDLPSQVLAQVSRGINERVAHEVAHAWFPHVAKVARTEENWLSESLAEYASTVCIARLDTRDGKRRFDRKLSEWKSGAGSIGEGGSIYLAAHLGPQEADGRDWQSLLYAKGPLVLHAVRQQLGRDAGSAEDGDRQFLVWLRSYIRNFTFKTAETRHLIAILNQISGKDWQPWFERYVYGSEPLKID